MDLSTDADQDSRRESGGLVAGCLVTVVAVVPAVFWVDVEETFAIPKLIILVTISAICVIALGMDALTAPRPHCRLHVIDAFVSVYGLIVAASFVVSADRDLSLWGERLQRQGLVTTLTYLTLYGVARVSIDRRRFGVLVRAAVAGASFVATYALIQRAGLDPIWSALPQGRVFSTIGQANSLGAYLAMTVPLGVAVAVVERRAEGRVLWWLAVAVQCVALLFTMSHGAYLALAVAGAVGLIPAALSRRRSRGLAVAVVCGVIAVFALFATVPSVGETGGRVIGRTFAAESLRTGSVRDHLDVWTVALSIVADHPALGRGPDAFPDAFDDYRDEVLSSDRAQRFAPYRVESAHNIFLTAAVGSGIVAALTLAAAFFGGIVLGLRRRVEPTSGSDRALARAAGTALLAYVIANMFITAEFAGSSTAWILLGGVVAVATRDDSSAGSLEVVGELT